MRTLSTMVIAIKIVGYLDFTTGKIYKTKAALKTAITKMQGKVKEAAKDARDKAKNFLILLMQGQVLADKLKAAKRLLKAHWTFERQRVYLTLMKLYGKHIESYLKAA